jgi:hypothetical protein
MILRLIALCAAGRKLRAPVRKTAGAPEKSKLENECEENTVDI